MAKLRHIAIRTADPEATAAWYREAFGLAEVGRARNGVYLSDGDINIAVLRLRTEHSGEGARPGIDHFGFAVDDVEAAGQWLAALGAKRLPNAPLPGNEFEVKYRGPDGQVFDISAHGWIGARPASADPGS
ncbi:MAG: VOC family protein [Chloroflexi bacterium]|nr:VOC family protein [Chloroflexota bacterium]